MNSRQPLESESVIHTKYRPDIDGLRAIAILFVVAFHAFPDVIKGGFVGVDVFFVISGFLITSIILDGLERTSFSFTDFYCRRVRRIFPSLLVVLVASCFFGWFYLLANEYEQLGKHIAAGAGFVSNFVLWNESGYFDNAAETKPLLHLWSLGIEEQFYIFYPLLLWTAWRLKFNLLIVISAAILVSFGCNISIFQSDVVADFYSPLTRDWELMIGSFLACTSRHVNSFGSEKKYFDISHLSVVGRGWLFNKIPYTVLNNISASLGVLLILISVLVISKEKYFPGWLAIFPTIGSALIIAASTRAWFNQVILSNPLFVFIGLISYPLYLWHWVILSFARIIEGDALPTETRLKIVLLSFALAFLTYKLIEKPLRFGAHKKITTISLLFLMMVIGVVGFSTYKFHGFDFRSNEQNYKNIGSQFAQWDFKKNDRCNKKYGSDQLSFCVLTEKEPEIVLFGDSHANQLYPGLVKAYENTKGILSIGNGPPLDGVIVKFQNVTDHPWQEGFESYKRVSKIIADDPELQTVVLAASWEPLIHGQFMLEEHRLRTGNIFLLREDGSRASNNLELFKESFEKTLINLLNHNKKIVVLIDTPELMVNPRRCLKNIHSEKFCSFNKKDVLERQKIFRSYLETIKIKYPMIKTFDPVPVVCPEEKCFEYIDGRLNFRDLSHLSQSMSEKVGKELRVVIDSQL